MGTHNMLLQVRKKHSSPNEKVFWRDGISILASD